MSNAAERSSGFVECDMPVGTDAKNLNVLLHFSEKGVISVAFRLSVRRLTVFYVGVFKIDIYMIEKIVSHEIHVALIARYVKPRVFVKVYRFYVFITRSVFVMIFNHVFVKTDGRGSRCKP